MLDKSSFPKIFLNKKHAYVKNACFFQSLGFKMQLLCAT